MLKTNQASETHSRKQDMAYSEEVIAKYLKKMRKEHLYNPQRLSFKKI